jgi:predicted dehydrogenase
MGCGAQSNNHFRAIRELGAEKASVVAICDLREDRLEKAREIWPEARATKDFREMVAPADLDLVIVATLPNMHAPMALAALGAGAHVLCEKPFVMSLKEAEAVLDTAERIGRQVQVGTNMRYMPTSRYLHDLVASGEVGKPVFCKAWGCHRVPPWWAPHYHLAASGGGVLASTLIHGLDLSVWVGGSPNPVSVSAAMGRLFPGKRGPLASQEIRERYDAEDLFTALLRFDNGATYMLEGNWCDDLKDSHNFELVTTRATLTNRPFLVVVDENGNVVERTPQMVRDGDWYSSIRAQDWDLIERIRQGQPWNMQDPRQLLNLQKLIDGCYESARTGHEVRFSK